MSELDGPSAATLPKDENAEKQPEAAQAEASELHKEFKRQYAHLENQE
jgi:hypothetical protein